MLWFTFVGNTTRLIKRADKAWRLHVAVLGQNFVIEEDFLVFSFASSILGAFYAAVRNGFTENLHAIFCLAENSVGERSTRPDDIHILYSGKSVEINNTVSSVFKFKSLSQFGLVWLS